MSLPRCFGIIPARYGSSRFPGKPLADILGKPMIWHVYKRAEQCPAIHEVHLATDDEKIFEIARKFGLNVIMTGECHKSGTDRILEASKKLQIDGDAVVINIQGDEPALHPDMLTQLVKPFSDPDVSVSTLARSMEASEAADPDRVKVVWSRTSGRALYFSRSPIPYTREGKDEYWGHIGLYGYRFKILEQFVSLGPSSLELREKLEQLRLLEAGIPIRIVPTEHISLGVDRPEDIAIVTKMMQESPIP